MIDTLCVGLSRKLLPRIQKTLEDLKCYLDEDCSWSIKAETMPDYWTRKPKTIFKGSNSKTGVWVKIQNGYVVQVKASLPRVLHGSNAIQLKYNELDKAVAKLKEILSEISEEDTKDWDVFRLDLVAQIRCEVEKVLRLLRNLKTRLIRREAGAYRCEKPGQFSSVLFTGKNLTLSFYDKSIEINQKVKGPRCPEGKVLRIEVQLKKREIIKKYLPERSGFYLLPDWMKCYRIFRKVILTIQHETTLQDMGKYSEGALLAHFEASDYTLPNGLRPLQWYESSRKTSAVRRMRRQVQRFSAELLHWNLQEIFPVEDPPATVDIVDGRLVEVPKPFRDPSRNLIRYRQLDGC